MLYKRLALLFITLFYTQLRGEDLPIKYLGIDQGLSNNAVTCIYQDYQGFMWFGTYDGLNRFDSYNFTIFRNVIGDSTSLSTNSINCIEGDLHHNLWIGGQKGINIYNPVTATFYSPMFRLCTNGALQTTQDEIHCIKPIAKGAMLLGTRHSGLLLFEQPTSPGIQVALPPLAGNTTPQAPNTKTNPNDGAYNVKAIEYDSARQLVWVFIEQLGLFQYNIHNHTLRRIPSSIRQANCLHVDQQGNLWLGNDNGLYHYDTASHTFSSGFLPAGTNVCSFFEDRQHTLWIASNSSGVWQLPANTTKAVPFTGPDGTPVINSNAVCAIYEDPAGRKWFGTLRGGINLLAAKAPLFNLIRNKDNNQRNLVSNFILSFCEDNRHNVWIGTDGAGLRHWNRTTNTFSENTHNPADSHSISSNFITSITLDAANDLWVSTWFGGINCLRNGSHVFQHYTLFNTTTNEIENNVWLVYEDAQRNLWASATNDGSLYLLNRKDNRFDCFDPAIQNLQCLAEDRQGQLWGGNYTALIRIDRTHKQHRTYNIGYPVRCIHENKAHQLWIGTQDGGLLLFDRNTGHYTRITKTNGLPHNTILRILEDNKGNLWLSTYNGLCKFNPANRTCHNYTPSDGLQSSQFSFNASLALQSGECLFGGIKGFNTFFPDSIRDQSDSHHVYLNGLRIGNNPVEAASHIVSRHQLEKIEQLKLPYNQDVLSLSFVALEYGGPDKIKYAYYLEGWDKSWNYANNIRTANYSHLREGHYTFLVKVSNPDGTWSQATSLLQIIVLPPWYRTWWAWSLYAIALAGAIYTYIRYTRRQERLKYEIRLAHLTNEKDRQLSEKKLSFFTNISHEFRTSLSLIINPLKEKIGHAGNADKDLTIAYRNARRLLSLVNQLLIFRKADSSEDSLKLSIIHLPGLCQEVFQCFLQQAKVKHIDYQFFLPASLLPIQADYEKIEIALFNLLSNAFKFTPDGGAITLRVQQTSQGTTLSVQDSGCGIPVAAQQTIFEKFQQGTPLGHTPKSGFGIGLYLVRQFVERHHGTVTCYSTPNQGTTFTLLLPKLATQAPAIAPTVRHELLEELAFEETAPNFPQPPPTTSGKTAEEVITNRQSLLVVDDNTETCAYLQHIFEHKYLVHTATSSAEAEQLALQHLPDLIISDVHMEHMNGVELCTRLKQSDKLSHIPVIILTATTSPDIRLKSIEGGADDFITKPFDKDLLLAKVENILRNRNLLQRYFLDNITLRETSIKVPAEYQDFLRKCIATVEENIDTEDFTIKKFSQAMGMSHSGLYQKVKSISGQSLNAFIRSIRLRRAAVLMLTEAMPVNQAAFQVGIGDIKYFREQFVKLFGITPSQYIKQYRATFNNTYHTIKPVND